MLAEYERLAQLSDPFSGSEARNHPPLIATESFGGTDEEPPAPNEPDHADMAPDLLLDVLQASQSDKGSRDASIVSFAAQARRPWAAHASRFPWAQGTDGAWALREESSHGNRQVGHAWMPQR